MLFINSFGINFIASRETGVRDTLYLLLYCFHFEIWITLPANCNYFILLQEFDAGSVWEKVASKYSYDNVALIIPGRNSKRFLDSAYKKYSSITQTML